MAEGKAGGKPQGKGYGVGACVFGNAGGPVAYSLGLLVLRLMVGVIMMYHGAQKGFASFGGDGFEQTVGFLTKVGFASPKLLAGCLVLAELLGGFMVIIGFGTRLGAAGIAIVMIVALSTVHKGNPFAQTHGQQMILAAAIALLIAGGGMISLWPGGRRRT